MSVYTLETLFHQLEQARNSRLRVPLKSRVDTYKKIWEAVNRWLLFRLEQGRGAKISNFASWSWENHSVFEGSQRGYSRKRRPFFQFHDAFNRTFGLPRNGGRKPPQLAKCEEINTTKIAIKYSSNLTKDMVFSGLRDIIAKIGAVIGAGYHVAICFSFGILYAKRKNTRFEVDGQLLSQLGAQNSDVTDQNQAWRSCQPYSIVIPDSNTVAVDPIIEEEKKTNNPEKELITRIEASDDMPEEFIDSDLDESDDGQYSYHKASRYKPTGDITVLPSQRVNEDAPDYHAYSQLLMEENSAIEDAYRRHLEHVRQKVAESEFYQKQFYRNIDELNFKAKAKTDRRAQNNLDTQAFIRKQMEEKKISLNNSQLRDIEIAKKTHCSFPPLVMSIANENPKLTRYSPQNRERQHRTRQMLQTQIDYKRGRKKDHRTQQKTEERNFLSQVQDQMATHKRQMYNRKLAIKQRLVKAWDRDRRMKQLLRQGVMLKQSPHRNNSDADTVSKKEVMEVKSDALDTPPITARSELSHFSVGFDMR